MKVLSWNILANEFIKKSYYPMINSKILFNRKGRLSHITTILKNASADVMLLQEVMQTEYNSLYETFNSDYYIIKGNNITWSNKKSYSGNVTFLNKTLFFLSENNSNPLIRYLPFGLHVKCYFLDTRNDVKENVKENICSLTSSSSSSQTYHSKLNKNAYIKPKSNYKLTPIDIINVHLDYNSHAKRISEIKSIESEINKSSRVILGGDFNQDHKPSTHLYQLLQSMRLKLYIKDPTYLIKKISIDHIMTKGFSGNSYGCVINNYGNDIIQQFIEYGSDHLPVITII